MRKIEIVDDLRLRFPGRDNEFNVGVEVGALSVLMAQATPLIERRLSIDAVEQLRPIAEGLRYVLTATEADAGMMNVSIMPRSRRPMLRVV
jgi:hypothetical protein